MKDFLVFGGCMLALLAIVTAITVAIGFGLVHWQCAGYEDATSLQTKVRGGTCFIQVKDQWMTYEELKFMRAS